jgi:aspartyl-tRNA(Asn)/glutamyl-tRNA(Gln) amidotransferase subunit B
MQEGNFRCDANVSVRPKGSSVLGTRVEIKNVNSFRFVEKAIAFEIQRQIAVLASGKAVIQETRLYDSQRDHTVSMRIKEEAEDYRYFPDPDLLPLKFPVAWVQEERDRLPELPAQKRSRYQTDFGLSRADSRQMSASQAISEIFEATVSLLKGLPGGAKWVANLLSGEVSRLLQESELSLTQSPLKAQHLADLGALALSGELSSTATKKILHEVWRTGESVGALVERLGLRQQNDASELEPLVETILKEQPQATEELRSGKLKVLGFLVGMVMKRSAGRGNPELIRSLIERTLDLKKDA